MLFIMQSLFDMDKSLCFNALFSLSNLLERERHLKPFLDQSSNERQR